MNRSLFQLISTAVLLFVLFSSSQAQSNQPALFGILFLLQIPHFLGIAWFYREDYARGGLPMLPVIDPAGVVRFRTIAEVTARGRVRIPAAASR